MTTPQNLIEPAPLAEQRETLRRRLQTQRQQIARQLSPETAGNYPRSLTMRFFTQQPALAAKLVVGLATLLMGARLIKSLSTALAVAQLVRTTVAAMAPPGTKQAVTPEMDLAL